MRIAIVLAFVGALLATPFYLEHKKEQRATVALARAQFASDLWIVAMDERAEQATGREPPAGHKPLLQDSERRFMEACRSCASAETCEHERLSVARGVSSENYNPCD